MKPTEADIQAELIEGWEILNGINFGTKTGDGGWVDIRHTKTQLKVTFYENFKDVEFSDGLDDSGATIDTEDFITGNYDLSAISQHYEPEEWQRIITMCERIVRLITGEQVEQSLEKKVREILEPWHDLTITYIHEDEVSLCSESRQYWITTNNVSYDHHCQSVEDYTRNSRYGQPFAKVAALLTTRSTKPSYSDLEQRVEELERIQRNLNQEVSSWMNKFLHEEKTTSDLRKEKSELERENASLIDRFGPIDQAEQQVAEVETRFQKLANKAERIADIMLQLNEEIL